MGLNLKKPTEKAPSKSKPPKSSSASGGSKMAKRLGYFILAAVISAVLSGGMIFLLHGPKWESGFTYMVMAREAPEHGTGQAYTQTPIAAQVEIIRSERFLEQVSTQLKKEGMGGWSPRRIQKAITVINPPQTNLIHVTVRTGNPKAATRIAQLLHQQYSSYVQKMDKDIVEKEKTFVRANLDHATKQLAEVDLKLAEQERNLHEVIGQTGTYVALEPEGKEAMARNYSDMMNHIKDLEANIAESETRNTYYTQLLNADEKSLFDGVVLGEDPSIHTLMDRLADAEVDANIKAVKYTPNYPDMQEANTQVEMLKQQILEQSQRILGKKLDKPKPVIQDSLRKGFVKDLLTNKINLEAATKVYSMMNKRRESMLGNLDKINTAENAYDNWRMQKVILQDSVKMLRKHLADLDYQMQTMMPAVQVFREIPSQPEQVMDMDGMIALFGTAFAALFLSLSAVPFVLDYRSSVIPTRSILSIVNDLMAQRERQIIMMMPVSSGGHLTAAAHLSGMLNQFGKNSLVIDSDLRHRLLSRKIPLDHEHGVFEHLLDQDMKKPYTDPLSGAKIIPLEATLDADRIVEFSQVVQRLHRIWDRWPTATIILDIYQWHEAYHQLLPFVSQVIFYVAPDQKTNMLLPKVFKGKYGVSVNLVEIQPDM